MAHADPESLKPLLPLLRQLREIKGLREASPGVFHCRGQAFIHFHVIDGAIHADLKKPAAGGFDKYPVETPTQQRKLVDDAKRRAARADDD